MQDSVEDILNQKDWTTTALGNPAGWPRALQSLVKVLLSSRFPMFLFWGPDLISFYNDAYRPSLGQNGKHPHILGLPGQQAWPELWHTIKPLLDEALAGRPVWREDMLVPLFRNGRMEDAYWTFSYSAVYDDSGKPNGVLVTCQETTAKIQATQRLAESENRFREIIAQAPIGIAIFKGHELRIELANQVYLDIIHRKEGEVVGRELFDVLPELRATVEELLLNVIRTGEPYFGREFKVPLRRYEAIEDAWFNFVYHPLLGHDGKTEGVILVASEVTDEVRQKRKIQESEKKITGFLMNSPVPMSILAGPDFIVETANNAMVHGVWKRNRAEVMGKRLFDLYPELINQKFYNQLNQVYRTGIPYTEKGAVGYIHINGVLTRLILDYEYAPLFDDQQQVWGVMTTLSDVTQTLDALEKVEKARQTLSVVIEASQLGTWELDLASNEMNYSERFGEILGLPREKKVTADQFDAYFHPSDAGLRQQAYLEALKSGTFHYVARVVHDGVVTRWIEKRGKLFHGSDGTPERIVGTLADITHERKLQEVLEGEVSKRTRELEQKNRELAKANTELRTFTFISSHDLQEPLRKIQLLTSRITEMEQLSEKGRDVFERVVTSANRMQMLLRDLVAHSEASDASAEYQHMELKQVVDELRIDFRDALQAKGGTIELLGNVHVRVIPHQFRQLLHNLVSNSLKYARSHVSPRIEVSGEPFSFAPGIHPRAERQGSRYMRVRVADNGIGFEQSYSKKIFEVFQRLHRREEYPGSGVGLAIVKRIAENHGGFVEAAGQVGVGATVDVYLPVFEPGERPVDDPLR